MTSPPDTPLPARGGSTSDDPTGRPRTVLFGGADDQETRTVADILRQETVGGALMLAATAVALVWANAAPASYTTITHAYLGPLDLRHWAADGLLTIFFFVAGLELKRELTVGSLARPAEALVPVVAAVGGMVAPALIYLAINLASSTGEPRGWAIPMATDIAFALAILAVAAPGLPASLRAFLLTLAIVDDLGAIVVIAIVFTDDLSPLWLAAAAAVAAVWGYLHRRRVRTVWVYLPLGMLCWACTLQSGVHATIAGVALGLLTRGQPRARRVTDPAPDRPEPKDEGLLDHWEHAWRPVSAAVAVPAFALLSAGVVLTSEVVLGLVTTPVAQGIILGLILGKVIGIWGGAYLTARFTRAELAPDLRWSEVGSVALLSGVGFTVALLISELAFPGNAAVEEEAKAAVLIGSLLASGLAAFSLRRRRSTRVTASH